VSSMYKRLAIISRQLEYYAWRSVVYRPHAAAYERRGRFRAPEGSGGGRSAPEGYTREGLKEYHTFYSAQPLVDAVPPESETARKFNDLAKLIAGEKHLPSSGKKPELACALAYNDARLQPLLEKSEITANWLRFPRSLSQVAAMGLQALDDLQNHRVARQLRSRRIRCCLRPQKSSGRSARYGTPSVQLLVQPPQLNSTRCFFDPGAQKIPRNSSSRNQPSTGPDQ